MSIDPWRPVDEGKQLLLAEFPAINSSPSLSRGAPSKPRFDVELTRAAILRPMRSVYDRPSCDSDVFACLIVRVVASNRHEITDACN